MHFGEIAFRGDCVAGPKMTRVNPFANGALDALISRETGANLRGHAKLLDAGNAWNCEKVAEFMLASVRETKAPRLRERQFRCKKPLK